MTLSIPHPQNKIHHNSRQQGNSQNCRSEAIVESALASAPDTLCSPVECRHGVDHGRHGNDGEEGGGDAADAVAEVEESDCQAA